MSDRRARNSQRRVMLRRKMPPVSQPTKIIQPTEFILNNSINMPSLGVGINRLLADNIVKDIVNKALKAGYRLFDTSSYFGNEYQLQIALKELLPKYKMQRSDVFITTKLTPGDFGDSMRTENGFLKSLQNLGSEYIDLYLIENPGAHKLALNDASNNKMIESTWSKLVQMYNDGKVNALGVSNFNVRMLENLMRCNYGIDPTVNQVEWHPYRCERGLYRFCKENDILIQADSTLGCPLASKMLKDPLIVNIAKSLDVESSEVILGWSLQRDVAVIPRSVSVENTQIDNIPLDFKMSDRDMLLLDKLTEMNAW